MLDFCIPQAPYICTSTNPYEYIYIYVPQLIIVISCQNNVVMNVGLGYVMEQDPSGCCHMGGFVEAAALAYAICKSVGEVF